MKTCTIIGAGEFNKENFKLHPESFLISADGGTDYLVDLNIQPDLIIGDMDSISQESKDYYSKFLDIQWIQLPEEKDDTDILAAIRIGMERGYREFHIYGGCGGRLDHTLANINCLTFLKNNLCQGYLYGNHETLQVIENETITFAKDKTGRISIFAIDENVQEVTLHGLKYTLKNASLTNAFPIGVSNEFIGEESTISVKKGKLLLVYEP